MFLPSAILDPFAAGGGATPIASCPAAEYPPAQYDVAAGMLWGRIALRGEERACFVSRATSFGAMLRVAGAVARNDAVTLYLDGMAPIEGKVCAVEGGRVRLSFARPVVFAQRIGPAMRHGPGVALTRYGADLPGRLRLGTTLASVRVLDISQGGAKLALAETLGVDQLGLLNFSGAGVPRAGRVRWCHDGRAGLQFVEPLARADLDCVLDFIRAGRTGAATRLR